MENVFKIENSGPPVRELIDGEEVMYKMREILPPFEETGDWYENADPKEIMEMVDELYNIVQCQPTIEAQEVRYGKWETSKGERYSSRCSCCNCYSTDDYKYCPNCGARMDLKE